MLCYSLQTISTYFHTRPSLFMHRFYLVYAHFIEIFSLLLMFCDILVCVQTQVILSNLGNGEEFI